MEYYYFLPYPVCSCCKMLTGYFYFSSSIFITVLWTSLPKTYYFNDVLQN